MSTSRDADGRMLMLKMSVQRQRVYRCSQNC